MVAPGGCPALAGRRRGSARAPTGAGPRPGAVRGSTRSGAGPRSDGASTSSGARPRSGGASTSSGSAGPVPVPVSSALSGCAPAGALAGRSRGSAASG